MLERAHAEYQPGDPVAAIDFDNALFGHIGYAISNVARSFFLALTHAKFSRVPLNTPTRRYYQNINRYSAAFALASDFAMLTLGGDLKRRELLSARLQMDHDPELVKQIRKALVQEHELSVDLLAHEVDRA